MNTPIEFKRSTQLLSVHLANAISNKNVTSIVGKLTALYKILKMDHVTLFAITLQFVMVYLYYII